MYFHPMQRILIFLYGVLSLPAAAQTMFSKTSVDFGDLYAVSERFEDILVTNKGEQKAFILRVSKPEEVLYRASADILLPDSSFSFRLQVNPQRKGPFSYDVEIFTSDRQQPVTIHLSGNVKELPQRDLAGMQSCPDFGSVPSRVQTREITIFTVDAANGQPLAKSTVSMIRNGLPAGSWITGKKGSFQQESAPGYFYFYATHDGYFPKEAGVYVGPQISEITIPLNMDPSKCMPVPQPEETAEIIPEEAQQLPESQTAIVIDRQLSNERSDSVIRQEMPQLAEIDPNNFDDRYFKPVNVVFVLDISSSMKLEDKMDLMKFSLHQLAGTLRPQDRIGLVTYSDGASVLLSSTSCTETETIRAKVAELTPRGMTAGGKGIKLGYREVMKSWSSDKANMVIIITDGAFNRSSDDYQKTVRKYAKKGVVFSVVGIRNRPNDERAMREAAEYGKGRYVPISKLSDAQFNLLQEIRIASFRGR